MPLIHHHIDPFGSADITITCDERDPNAAGASHVYVMQIGDEVIEKVGELYFQHGPRGTDGKLTGLNHAAVLAVLIDRYEALQAGPHACESNDRCLAGLRTVLDIERSRTAERKGRGVLGANKA